jgi:hypothetical protein
MLFAFVAQALLPVTSFKPSNVVDRRRPRLRPATVASHPIGPPQTSRLSLENHPRLGRAGTEPGIRELIIGGTPYIVLYRVSGQRVIISTIWHGAQRKKL